MIKLFSKPNCPQCVETKMALKSAGVEFSDEMIAPDLQNLKAACDAINIDYTGIKSAPVLIAGGSIWTGADCVIAVEEEEYK